MPRIEAFATAAEAVKAAAEAITGGLTDAVASRGRASFAGSGGGTPGPVYDRLSGADIPWSRISVTLTDERWVEVGSPESNTRLIRERLFVGAAGAAAFVPLKSGEVSEASAVAQAEAKVAPITPFNAVLLGMGEDGHIASLFPGSSALDAQGLVAWVPAAKPAPALPRLTLTFGALNASRLTVLLITGPKKREILEAGSDRPVHRHLARVDQPVRVLWAP
ncbi:MAG TPA: 6-phosphogluconolactonase [Caulobacteraceae bacterium]|jgi:6-phosphogluconolactonase